MEGTFVNDSELDKHVFYLVNSKKRQIGAPADCDGVRLNSRSLNFEK